VDASPLQADELRECLERSHGAPVDVRETHISWVLLTEQTAYKLKKPLVLPFLDYGTTERRREMCDAEVNLNRRLAPDLYLGVRGAMRTPHGVELGDADDPRAVDYVVEMRRYDEDQTVASLLARGELGEADIAAAGRLLARFHALCPAARDAGQGAWRTEQRISRNLDELVGVATVRAERGRIRALARFLGAFVDTHAETLDERAAAGLVREGHGDLRAEHVVIPREGGEVTVVDCAEFDAGLRTHDVADDLAYLVMDLVALGGERFVAPLVGAYRAAGGDCGEDPLLAFFAVHRALVRAKVILVRANQIPASSPERGQARAHAREMLAVAERFSWRARLPLAIVVCGGPASGKSHLAEAIARAARLPKLGSDPLRKALAGIGPSERADPLTYSEAFSRATYAELGRRAAGEISDSGGAIVDATFRRRDDRAAFADGFADAAPLVFVQCTAPAAVLAQRAAQRQRDPERISDATPEIVERESERWQPLDEVPAASHLILRTDRAVEAVADDVIALLDERLGRA
jgi:aminoglycoside phosphotransferase family enzyme/predicted kinase